MGTGRTGAGVAEGDGEGTSVVAATVAGTEEAGTVEGLVVDTTTVVAGSASSSLVHPARTATPATSTPGSRGNRRVTTTTVRVHTGSNRGAPAEVSRPSRIVIAMCGRFVSASKPDKIAEYFGAAFDGETLGENYNVAPTNDIYAVIGGDEGKKRMEVFRWGLIPVWAKEANVGAKMINARAETLAEKPAFKAVFKKHRAIIPMDGFYEWRAGTPGGPLTKRGTPAKQPMFIHRLDGEPLAVAGLWSAWRDKADEGADWLHSVSVITTSANETMAPIHNRMPVILPESVWDQWLDPGNHDLDSLARLLVPASDSLLAVHPVSTDVNNVRNKGPHLVDEVDAASEADVQLPLGG